MDAQAYAGPETFPGEMAPKPAPQVWNRFEQIEDRMDVLHKVLAELTQRVTPIMSPPAPQEAPHGPSDDHSVPVVARLEAHGRRLQLAIDVVADITSRLEI